jgi:transposase
MISHREEFVSYAGLATAVRQSGNVERHGQITKRGAQTAPRLHHRERPLDDSEPADRNPLADFYAQKRKERGAGKAIWATARKLLTVIFTLLTKDSTTVPRGTTLPGEAARPRVRCVQGQISRTA